MGDESEIVEHLAWATGLQPLACRAIVQIVGELIAVEIDGRASTVGDAIEIARTSHVT